MSGFRLVYVGGMGRSGSTLIERLLGELPGVCSTGELVHMWQRGLVDGEACGCGTPFEACAFWRDVGREAFGGWSRIRAREVLGLKASVDRMRFVPMLLTRRWSPEFVRRVERYTDLYDRLYGAVSRVSGCPVVVDASKHASLAACLRHRYGTDLRVVHVVRDPRAVAYSWGKRVPRPMATSTSVEQEMARYSPGRAALHWTAQNATLAVLARQGVPTMRVRYEDFAARPHGCFEEIAAFVGHRGELPIGVDGTARLTGSHAVSGNPWPASSWAVTVREDTAWRRQLPPGNRALVSALTAPARWRYGY